MPTGTLGACKATSCDCEKYETWQQDNAFGVGQPEDVISVPKPIEATRAEIIANMRTHHFDRQSSRCFDCEARRGSTSSTYPCGAVVPRVYVRRGTVAARRALYGSMGLALLDLPSE